MRLPVDWSRQGVYEWEKVDGSGVTVRNKRTHQEANIEETRDQRDLSEVSVVLDLNWSEHRAIVHISGAIVISKVCISLTGMATELCVQEHTRSKQRRLKNGSVGASSSAGVPLSASVGAIVSSSSSGNGKLRHPQETSSLVG